MDELKNEEIEIVDLPAEEENNELLEPVMMDDLATDDSKLKLACGVLGLGAIGGIAYGTVKLVKKLKVIREEKRKAEFESWRERIHEYDRALAEEEPETDDSPNEESDGSSENEQ